MGKGLRDHEEVVWSLIRRGRLMPRGPPLSRRLRGNLRPPRPVGATMQLSYHLNFFLGQGKNGLHRGGITFAR